MTITQLFDKLNAPLANKRWSWGSIRNFDGAVILRVWQDEKIKIDGRYFMRITHHKSYVGSEGNEGYKERNRHAGLVQNGSKCYMVMCIANDPKETPRKIQSFNSDDIFVGGEVVMRDGDTWVEFADRIPIQRAIA